MARQEFPQSAALVRVHPRRSGARTGWQRFRWVLRGDSGMSTAEYAIGTVAAAAFGSLLYTIVTSASVTGALSAMIERALAGNF